MSIIHEALKKTQDSLVNQRINQQKDKNDSLPITRKKVNTSQNVNRFILIMVCIFLTSIAGLGYTLLSLLKQSKETKLTDKIVARQAIPEITVTAAKPTVILKGTMRANDEYVALIGENIYRIGENVGEDLKVINISEEQVELDNKGEIIILNVRYKPNL